jgi:hypothetical protein
MNTAEMRIPEREDSYESGGHRECMSLFNEYENNMHED